MSPPGRPKGEYRSAQREGSPMSLVVGLTGGIGSGKSAVAAAFAVRNGELSAATNACTSPQAAAVLLFFVSNSASTNDCSVCS